MLQARTIVVILLAVVASACAPTTEAPEPAELISRVGDRIALLPQAHCSIQVKGLGAKATELDYLPHVLACENNGADLEALKAQAIAARSVAYYEMASKGSICTGQGCQVYACSNQPTALHYQAVAETAQQYLGYAGLLTYGFFVAGDANVAGPSCQDSAGSSTKYVTFNQGKSGTDVQQSKLGYVGPPGFGQNRGCMSQYGARCLEDNGYGYLSILRFYYGEDIEIVTAPGACEAPESAPAESDSEPAAGSGGSEPLPEPDAPAAGSCAAHCGSQSPVPGSSPACYCDDACLGFGDCCADFASVCP